MNKINSFTFTALSVIILLISLLAYKSSIKELKGANEDFIQFEKVSAKYNSLKKNWDPAAAEKRITKAAKLLRINNLNITKKGRLMVIKSDKLPLNKMDKFLNKLLNESLIIKKLYITNDSFSVSVEYK